MSSASTNTPSTQMDADVAKNIAAASVPLLSATPSSNVTTTTNTGVVTTPALASLSVVTNTATATTEVASVATNKTLTPVEKKTANSPAIVPTTSVPAASVLPTPSANANTTRTDSPTNLAVSVANAVLSTSKSNESKAKGTTKPHSTGMDIRELAEQGSNSNSNNKYSGSVVGVKLALRSPSSNTKSADSSNTSAKDADAKTEKPTESDGLTHTPFAKLCHSIARGECVAMEKGRKCAFSHRFCREYREGNCTYGKDCHKIHHVFDLAFQRQWEAFVAADQLVDKYCIDCKKNQKWYQSPYCLNCAQKSSNRRAFCEIHGFYMWHRKTCFQCLEETRLQNEETYHATTRSTSKYSTDESSSRSHTSKKQTRSHKETSGPSSSTKSDKQRSMPLD
jgi:hypothetical protein